MAVDWDNFPHNDIPKAKQISKNFYDSIGKVKCPALNDEYVSFNKKGYGHLIYKQGRNPTEITERLCLLRYAEKIISDPFIKITHRLKKEKQRIKKSNSRQLYEVDVHYWGFEKFIDPELIKVVVRQIENGEKHFYSIMLIR